MAKTIVKKKWFKLIAPKLFNEEIIGETPTVEAKSLIGKTVTISLFVLTNDIKRQNTDVSFIIEEVEGDKAKTSVISMVIIPNTIRRIVRKGKSRIDLTIRAITKDEKIVTLKPMIITRKIVKGSVSKSMFSEIKRIIIKKVSSLNCNELTEEIITGKLTKELIGRISKIYPVKICEIREYKIERSINAVDARRIKEEVAKEIKKQSRPEAKEEEEVAIEDAEHQDKIEKKKPLKKSKQNDSEENLEQEPAEEDTTPE